VGRAFINFDGRRFVEVDAETWEAAQKWIDGQLDALDKIRKILDEMEEQGEAIGPEAWSYMNDVKKALSL
jgi:hypothetical protein